MGGKLVIGLCLKPGARDHALCCGRAFFPSSGPKSF